MYCCLQQQKSVKFPCKAAYIETARRTLFVTDPSQAIERRFHLLPKLFERLAAHGKTHESLRNLVSPARAPFSRSLHAPKAGGRANHFATIDEFLRGIPVAQRYAQNISEP